MAKIETSTEVNQEPREFSFQEIYDKVRDLNQHKSDVEWYKNVDQGKELDSQLFSLVKQLNDDFSLWLDNNSLDLQADDWKLQINYRSSEYWWWDKKVQIIIDENTAHQVVYDWYDGWNILFENTFEKKSEQEKLAIHSFNELYNKISSRLVKYTDENGVDVDITFFWVGWETKFDNNDVYNYNSWSEWQGICIERHKTPDINTRYSLIKMNNGTFYLDTDDSWKHTRIDNLTPEELFNNILPNFEKRLNEGEMLRVQKRQRALEDANQYAYQQDQQDADRLLQENWLA